MEGRWLSPGCHICELKTVSLMPLSFLSPRGLVIAMVLSLLFIVLLRFLAGIMVWVMIVMVILVLGYGVSPPPSYFSLQTLGSAKCQMSGVLVTAFKKSHPKPSDIPHCLTDTLM